jgi:branched-subunit amino acid aminotransferase/4-amino-4-deoxychorismate lyase
LITPKNNILFGITRNLVIRLARKMGYNVMERDIKIRELFLADEAFITATNKDIVPVVKVDNKKIGNGMPGKFTKDLIKVFAGFIKTY